MTARSATSTEYTVVVPTIGRPGLRRLLLDLAGQDVDARCPAPAEVIVVDDRRDAGPALMLSAGRLPLRVVRGHGRGPAHARNRGWQVATTPWVAFLDDDVELPAQWCRALAADLAACDERTAATQGAIVVPSPRRRRPTDWERNVAALQEARWATADMAYRREALLDVAGFDERFPRAFREDADLALRVRRAGWSLTRGERHVRHPVRPAPAWISVRLQEGNADDALMRRLHGRDWHADAQAPTGRFAAHAATVAAGTAALAAAAARPVLPATAGRVATGVAAGAALAWAGLTARFLGVRLRPGPRPGEPGCATEFATMAVTSVLIPPAAVAHRVRGARRHRRSGPWPPPPLAVLFDRDGTLIHDVPYNTDPRRVVPVDGARESVAAVRRAGLAVGVISNQSAIGRGLATAAEVEAVDERVRELLGPFDTWQRCPHVEQDACGCRKPAAGLIRASARQLRVEASRCVVIGDIGADVEAALAAGARPILVPTPATRSLEVGDAPWVATTLGRAVELALAPRAPQRGPRPTGSCAGSPHAGAGSGGRS